MLDNKILLNNIKKLCNDNNIKITNLEKELGFGAGIISRWGNNADPSLSKIIDIADYFNISLDEVVGRNQNQNDENHEFVYMVIEQTNTKQLQWSDFMSIPYGSLPFKMPEETNVTLYNFGNYPDCQRDKRHFIAKCNQGHLILVCYLIIINNTIDKYEFFLYIQPNDNSEPVYQKCNQEQLLNLYKTITLLLYGKTPEMEANDFKKQFINQSLNNFAFDYWQEQSEKMPIDNDKIEQMLNDENIKQSILTSKSAEMQKVIRMFTNPELSETIKTAERLMKYFSALGIKSDDSKIE